MKPTASKPSARSAARLAAAGALALCLGLVGCAPLVPSDGVTSAASGSPTTAPAAGSEPAQAFGGDCSTVFSDADLGTALGAPVTPSTPESRGEAPAPYRSAVEAIGGLSCTWTANPAQNGATEATVGAAATVVVFAEKAVPNLDDSPPNCYASSAGGAASESCSFTSRSAGYVLSAVLTTAPAPGQSEADAQADATSAARQVEAAFQKSAAAQQPMPAGATIAGRWKIPGDCAALEQTAGVAAALASPGLVAFDGDSQSEAPPGYYAALDASGYRTCLWQQQASPTPSGQVSGFSIYVLPGGGWNLPAVEAIDGAADAAIPGVEKALLVPQDGADPVLQVFDGANWLMVQSNVPGEPVEDLYPAVTALVTELNLSR